MREIKIEEGYPKMGIGSSKILQRASLPDCLRVVQIKKQPQGCFQLKYKIYDSADHDNSANDH